MFYGGKGGVGKTTCAAARAVAEAATRVRVLVVSTDPAHSLGDALGVKLRAAPRAIRRGLSASELDGPRAFARWIDQHGAALGEALEHGTWLDRADVDALIDLPLPGIDELTAILEIARLGEHKGHKGRKGHKENHGRYDVVVVDTAPTGHTLRLLAAPQTVAAVADVLDALQAEHRLIRDQLARVGRPEAADRLIAELAAQARNAGELLRDPTRTTFCWVTLPEALSLAETEDGLAALDAAGVRAAEIVVNRVLPAGGPCPVCDRRRASERPVIAAIRRRFGRGRTMRIIAADVGEPRGVAPLGRIGQILVQPRSSFDKLRMSGSQVVISDKLRMSGSQVVISDKLRMSGSQVVISDKLRMSGSQVVISDKLRMSGSQVVTSDKLRIRSTTQVPTRLQLAGTRSSLVVSLSNHERTTSAESLDVIRGAKLLFVGGKGGVGKTTVSAAAAVRLARAHPERRMLLLSTDPAHSIADVLDAATTIGDAPRALRGGPANLFVRELDAARALAARRADLEKAFDEIAATVGAGSMSRATGSAAEVIDLAPPGIDELFGMLEVVRLIASPRGADSPTEPFDVVIVDTAPTGHALRLLEMPEDARAWVQVLMRMLLKYKSLVRAGQLAAELVDVSKTIRALQTMLRDAAQTRFLVVTRAAEVPRFETERLLDRLRRLRLATPAVVVNAMTLAPGRCARCRATAAAERRSLGALRRRCGQRSRECIIIKTALAAPPPRGVHALGLWADRWVIADR